MAITSIGYDGSIDETGFGKLMDYSASARYGVNSSGAFKATTVAGQVLQVSLAAGTAWTSGLVDVMDAAQTIQLEGVTSGSRWDMIVLRRDWQPPGGNTTLAIVQGGPGKAVPARNDGLGVLDDQPLWLVRVQNVNGSSVIAEYADLRVWARNGGCTANDDLVRGFLQTAGTLIEINGVWWLYRVAANGTNEWVKPVDLATAADSSSSSSGAAGKLVRRDSNHRFGVPGPLVGTHPANKDYVDDQVSKKAGGAMDAGSVTIKPTQKVTEGDKTYYRGSVRVYFERDLFSTNPYLTVSARSSVPGTVLECTYSDVTTEDAIIHVARESTTETTVTFTAVTPGR